jgi:hypothetical protein
MAFHCMQPVVQQRPVPCGHGLTLLRTLLALAAANIRCIYTFKNIDLGMSPDAIRYLGYDRTIHQP